MIPHHTVSGPEDAPVLVLSNSLGATLEMWDPQAHALAERFRLVRYDVFGRTFETVFSLDGDRHLWQMHSSADDRVHSATVKDAQDRDLGCVVYRNGRQTFFPAQGAYDECQIDASGRWLVIKEKVTRGGRGCDDNRVVDLETGAEQRLCDEAGAAVERRRTELRRRLERSL